MVSNFKFDFRGSDPDHRLRVQAIIQKTENEARSKISKKDFAKHLENSKRDAKSIVDSKKQRAKNQQEVTKEFYKIRDAKILEETGFDVAAELSYQRKQHFKFESNSSKSISSLAQLFSRKHRHRSLSNKIICCSRGQQKEV